MLLLLASTSLLNAVIFPTFDDTFTYARDISVLTNAVALIATALIATWKPAWLHVRPFTVGTLLALVVGAVLIYVGVWAGQAATLLVGSCLHAAGRGIATLYLGIAFTRLNARSVSVALAAAFVLVFPVQWLLLLSGSLMASVVFYVLPFAVLALSWTWAKPTLEATQLGHAPADLAITRPSTFLPLASQLFVCIFLFKVAFGYSLRFGEYSGTPVSDFLALPVLVAVAVWVFLKRKGFPADHLTAVSVLLIVAGFLVASSGYVEVPEVATGLLTGGANCFDLVAWAVLIALASRNRIGAVAVIAWGRGIGSLGTIVGAGIGTYVNATVNIGMADLISGVIIIIFVAYALIGLKGFSFTDTIAGVKDLGEVKVAPTPDERLQQRCEALAQTYKLGPRELEVFIMLARGRDAAYIQQKLVVSRNTVKAHIKHIYAKTGVHDHQALIDLVEE